MTEEWVPVKGWEGFFEVSDLGRVRSLDRETVRSDGRTYRLKGRVKKTGVNSQGYPQVRLSNPDKREVRTVHTLVAEHFCGGRESGMEVCHWNGVKTDCRASNLRWGTRSDNALDKQRHGVDPNLNKTHCPYGHLYSEENTYVWKGDGRRRCRICIANKKKERRGQLTSIGVLS